MSEEVHPTTGYVHEPSSMLAKGLKLVANESIQPNTAQGSFAEPGVGLV